MAIRFAAASALAIVAALVVAAPARAQFFSFYERSPREIVGMLSDDGYSLRGPMTRRGDVYVVNVISVTGHPARLILDAHDGHILQRFETRHARMDADDDDTPHSFRPPRNIGGDDDYSPSYGQGYPHQQQALGDPYAPPRRDFNDDMNPRPDADSDPAPKPRHHAVKKHVAKAPPLRAPAVAASPAPTPSPSVAAVAPSAPAPEVKTPVEAPKVESTPKPAVRVISTQAPEQAKAEPAPTPSPKPEPQHKKVNDLPVDTLN